MAKFKYLGPDPVSIRGIDFTPGEPVEVEDEANVAKFRALTSFEEVDGEDSNGEPKKRGPGRPKLSEEAKTARAAEKQKYTPIATDVGPHDSWDEDDA
jgi:hypothetical protein